jgi:hypothetical protein
MRNAAAASALAGAKASKAPRRHLPRWAPVAIAACLLAALSVAALRVDLIRLRYGLARALERERALLEERRDLLATMGGLRDPSRLARAAQERGFVRPKRIVDLPQAPPVPAAGARP